MKANNFNLGYFIKQEHVDKAFDLITTQLNEKSFTFKTIDFEIYRNEVDIKSFDKVEFYERFILKDTLYNYRSIFYNLEYTIPKGAYGIRYFNFTSFHSTLLYYSLGFYFYDLMKETLSRIEPVKAKLENINTYYGGRINFDKPSKSEVYYHNDYNSFNIGVKKSISDILTNGKKACVIKLDIQDYYFTIRTSKLLDVIDKFSLPSSKKRLKFDNVTKESISSLLLFYMKRDKGLPLSAQNIFSNFISNIFLFELDNFVQKLPVYKKKGFSYYRYVDDFYLIFDRKSSTKNNKIGNEIFNITSDISDFLTNSLGLKINHLKSQKWIIEDLNDFNDFVKSEKFISFFDPLKKKKPKEQLEQVCDIIQKLKDDFKKSGTTTIANHEDLALKEIFISSIKNFVKSKHAEKSLDKAFKNWNPILTLNSVRALMFLIGNSTTGYKAVKKYLEDDFEQKIKKTQNIYLLEKFIKLDTYDKSLNKLILQSESKSQYFQLIKRSMSKSKESITKYLPIEDTVIQTNNSLGQQIKMMVLAEEEGKYNLAFNHLLNTFHEYCFIKDSSKKKKELKNYDVNSVVEFLTKNKAAIEEVNFVMSFFDRRNKNNISHPGEILMENWVVNKTEYKDYYRQMINLMKRKIK